MRLLAGSTDIVVRLAGLHQTRDARVTEEDVRGLIAQARATGEVHAGEEEIANRALHLGDRPVSAIVTPRTELHWVDLHEDSALIRRMALEVPHDHLLVCRDTVDNVLGVVLDEYGGVQGFATVWDVCRDVIGELPGAPKPFEREPRIVADGRADGWSTAVPPWTTWRKSSDSGCPETRTGSAIILRAG